MRVKPFFPVFIVLVGVVVYAYYAPKERPERAITLTPKQYIETVEREKAARKQNQERIQAAEKASAPPTE
ncbi:MAG: hypothetical protein GY934_01360 [Gammaproteobacteria bacterium]|nr:hypothetical protein [Gammaproteobacteria bacterium]